LAKGSPDRYTAEFSVTPIDSDGRPISGAPNYAGLTHGKELTFSAGNLINVEILQTSGQGKGALYHLAAQPFQFVAPEYDIGNFFQEEGAPQNVWAIGSPNDAPDEVHVLRSTDYFQTTPKPTYTIKRNGSNDPNFRGDAYRSIYVDLNQNVIIGWRPGPLISGDQGKTFTPLFEWMDPDYGMLCPFWNITEAPDGQMVISEYGSRLAYQEKSFPNYHGTHRGTFWSKDPNGGKKEWQLRTVDAGFDKSKPDRFSGYIRHIHGYHINPKLPNVHHLFLGDPAVIAENDSLPPDAQHTLGYYVSQDGGATWSNEIISQWRTTPFFNGPSFVTWWDDGKALILSDTATSRSAYCWGSGPSRWGGPDFDPALELNADIDEESLWPSCHWMAMVVSDVETYCTTCADTVTCVATHEANGCSEVPPKEILWRYDRVSRTCSVIAEVGRNGDLKDPNSSMLRFLSGSRYHRIPAKSRYFFTSGNRRFSRL